MGHLWQRFLLAFSLLVGLAVGVAATVFGYSNLGTVDVHWSVFHLDGVPLWTVAIVPVALVLIAGTVYHWLDGLHHFSEHMRHRHRVRELEAEIARLREHLDHVLEMPRGDQAAPLPAPDVAAEPPASALPAASTQPEVEAKPEPEVASEAAAPEAVAPEAAASEDRPKPDRRKRSRIIMETEPAPAQANGAESEPVATTTAAGSSTEG